MRHFLLFLLLALLTGCATAKQSAMPKAHKYESNAKALQVYLRAYGDGYQNGCRMVTTDLTPWDMVYRNDDPFLQAAGLDGFNDGEQAAWKMVREAMRQLEKHTAK